MVPSRVEPYIPTALTRVVETTPVATPDKMPTPPNPHVVPKPDTFLKMFYGQI